VNAWVVRNAADLQVFLVNHALPRHPIAPTRVRVQLAQAPRPLRVSIERVDETHANAKRRWQQMGAAEYLDDAKLEQLHAASGLRRTACRWKWSRHRLDVELTLPPHGVALVTAEVPRQ